MNPTRTAMPRLVKHLITHIWIQCKPPSISHTPCQTATLDPTSLIWSSPGRGEKEPARAKLKLDQPEPMWPSAALARNQHPLSLKPCQQPHIQCQKPTGQGLAQRTPMEWTGEPCQDHEQQARAPPMTTMCHSLMQQHPDPETMSNNSLEPPCSHQTRPRAQTSY